MKKSEPSYYGIKVFCKPGFNRNINFINTSFLMLYDEHVRQAYSFKQGLHTSLVGIWHF